MSKRKKHQEGQSMAEAMRGAGYVARDERHGEQLAEALGKTRDQQTEKQSEHSALLDQVFTDLDALKKGEVLDEVKERGYSEALTARKTALYEGASKAKRSLNESEIKEVEQIRQFLDLVARASARPETKPEPKKPAQKKRNINKNTDKSVTLERSDRVSGPRQDDTAVSDSIAPAGLQNDNREEVKSERAEEKKDRERREKIERDLEKGIRDWAASLDCDSNETDALVDILLSKYVERVLARIKAEEDAAA